VLARARPRHEAIADISGVPVGTVRSRLSAAKRKLAEELLETAAATHDDDLARCAVRRRRAKRTRAWSATAT
jgi:hypothetical protein